MFLGPLIPGLAGESAVLLECTFSAPLIVLGCLAGGAVIYALSTEFKDKSGSIQLPLDHE